MIGVVVCEQHTHTHTHTHVFIFISFVSHFSFLAICIGGPELSCL